MSELAHWDSFYVIVGAAAGALVGLQFVVLTLIAERPPERDVQMAGAAFASPTIVHFGAALLVSAIMRMPWHSIGSLAIAWGCVGLFGVVYIAIVGRRMRSQSAYVPDFEDWIYHALVPIAGYGSLAISALAAKNNEDDALFAVGVGVLLLMFTGIHNAWDAVVYHAFVSRPTREGKGG